MVTKKTNEKLKAALKDVEPELNLKLHRAFQVLNPLELARLLNRNDLSDAVKASVLLLKVGLPPQSEGSDIDRAIDQKLSGEAAR